MFHHLTTAPTTHSMATWQYSWILFMFTGAFVSIVTYGATYQGLHILVHKEEDEKVGCDCAAERILKLEPNLRRISLV
jgi:hypothetical protein